MITMDVFNDLYQFLADIDASTDQVLKNYYFTDSLLSLFKESDHEDVKPVEEAPSTVEEESLPVEEEEMEVAKEEEEEDLTAISCPDIVADDFMPGQLDEFEKIDIDRLIIIQN